MGVVYLAVIVDTKDLNVIKVKYIYINNFVIFIFLLSHYVYFMTFTIIRYIMFISDTLNVIF